MSAVTVRHLVKRYRDFTALDDVSFDLPADTITGLLGRNGAGKTTLMRMLTGQGLATSGEIEVLGGYPYENERVLHQVSFVRESQCYPQQYQVRHVLSAGALLYPTWDRQYAADLAGDSNCRSGGRWASSVAASSRRSASSSASPRAHP